MGSIPSPPQSPPTNKSSSNSSSPILPQTETCLSPVIEISNELRSVAELRRLLDQRDQEIRALKFELEKYKLALHQSQLDFHYIENQQQLVKEDKRDRRSLGNVSNLIGNSEGQTQSIIVLDDSDDNSRTVEKRQVATRKARSGSAGATSMTVVFKTGGDDDEEDEGGDINVEQELLDEDNDKEQAKSIDDNLQDIIQDVSEIDLSLELEVADSKEKKVKARKGEGVEEEEDIISDGLLTSLTDAAISNLSQLAALQERCESQQHSQQYQQQPQQQSSLLHSANNQGNTQTTGGGGGVTSSSLRTNICALDSNQQTGVQFTHQDSYSVVNLANQAAIAIHSAATNDQTESIVPHGHHHHQQQPVSSSNSISPNSTIQADLSSSQSLASVVAAAAVAAAAVNDQQDQQEQLHHHHHQASLNHPQARLISSALPSHDFYHSLQQHHHAHNIQQQQQHSPVSSIHFSPSTSITPSPSSLLAHSRRSNSQASSSLMSPISSPNYLRRQFMTDRLPLMSPSPTSGITGSSSGASSSLAHILHQQRSASALAGSLMTPTSSGTPMSSGSTAVSPLLGNKNSSQARLNNMQIRHKFGYLGSGRAQFNSPHGFCLGLNQEIVVADTNNHRVCIFDKSGTYITQFGSPGKEEGQLWNPRKVAILHKPIMGHHHLTNSISSLTSATNSSHLHTQQRQSSTSPYSTQSNSTTLQTSGQFLSGTEPLYVVCDRGAERSRMQLFTKDGAFIKKIGIHYIDIVAGLAITQNGLIIVVDSVSPTVYIIDGETGILNGWFDCSGHMKEPSDIAVKSDVPGNEYFICDFKGHCVVVFSEQGEYLRKIGHDGLTSYPNGIDISDDGDILVGDSHGNRFHVVVFDRNGNFVSQFECPHVKVSRCCGLKITREGYIVTLAKNNHHVLVLDTIHI